MNTEQMSCFVGRLRWNRRPFIVLTGLLLIPAVIPQAVQALQNEPAQGRRQGFVRPDQSGTISEIKGDVYTLTSRNGTVKVTIPESAAIERMPEGKASRADLKADTRIGVYGKAGDDGTFTATRVVLLPARPAGTRTTPPAPTTTMTPEALEASRAKLEKDTPQITLSTSGAPDLSAWAARAKGICEAYYPFIAAYLKTDGFEAPKAFSIIVREMDGVAYTSGRECHFAAAWFRAHPDDYGAVVHEMTHVIQAYRGNNPGWLVEAIDDYIRFYRYEPVSKALHFTADRVPNEPQAYQIGAQFLDWAQTKYDKNLVPDLNTAMRKNTYSDDIWKQKTGKTIADLWKEWKATLPAKPSTTAAPKP